MDSGEHTIIHHRVEPLTGGDGILHIVASQDGTERVFTLHLTKKRARDLCRDMDIRICKGLDD